MSVDSSCYTIPRDIESGAGEMKCFKSKAYETESASITNIIASEIVSDIIENALDIVMERKPVSRKVESISSNVVGDILENILSNSAGAENRLVTSDETVLLDDEIKRIIKEMKCPPDTKSPITTAGVGDQLGGRDEISSQEILQEPPKRNTLERKNRLTNLVKNSKQMLARLVANDSQANIRMAQEEQDEQFIRIIHLTDDGENCHLADGQKKSSTFPRDSRFDLIELEPVRDEISGGEKPEGDLNVSQPGTSKERIRGKFDIKANINKRRWNFTSKIMKVLRRRPKKNTSEAIDQ